MVAGQVCRGLKPAGRYPPPGFGVDTDYDGDEDRENYATRVTAMSIAVGIGIVKILPFFLSKLESEY